MFKPFDSYDYDSSGDSHGRDSYIRNLISKGFARIDDSHQRSMRDWDYSFHQRQRNDEYDFQLERRNDDYGFRRRQIEDSQDDRLFSFIPGNLFGSSNSDNSRYKHGKKKSYYKKRRRY